MSLSDKRHMAGLFPKELRRLAKVVGLKSTVGTALDMAADEIEALRASQAKVVEALRDMESRKDAAYLERNQVVAALAALFPAGIARTNIPGWSEDWHGCIYIDLPTGQVSWHYHDSQTHLFAHLPPYAGKWDGHDTDEKYRRVAALAEHGGQT